MNGEDISIFKHNSHSITRTFGSSAQARLALLGDDVELVKVFGSLDGYLRLARLGESFGVRAGRVRQVSLRNKTRPTIPPQCQLAL